MPADQEPRGEEQSPAELTALRDQCTRFLHYHGPIRAADLLATVPGDTVPDRYGDGGVVADLEARIAALLGKPAAVFLPSGTMAQQTVLGCTPTSGSAAPCCSTRTAISTCTKAAATSGCISSPAGR